MLKKTSMFGLVAAGALAVAALSFVACGGTTEPADSTAGTCAVPADASALDTACGKLIATTNTKAACESPGTGDNVASYTVCAFTGTDSTAGSSCKTSAKTLTDACVDASYNTYATCGKGGLAVNGVGQDTGCKFTATK